ncbi:MAG: hypothetical protein H6R04_27 [Burkholderiaceae bacterium]|nr:hypothetical protein [Burkholderiaceae bacterium]
MKNIKFSFMFALAFLVAGSSFARDNQKELRFAPGTSSATVSNSVIRGDRDIYSVTAKAGQTMTVAVSAKEDNAAFQIYEPGAKFVKEDGMTDIKGATLPKAGEEDDAKSFSGPLPKSGKYLIVVGGTRGNASYKLKVAIK